MKDEEELGQRYCKEAEGGRRLICIILLSFLGFIFWGLVFGYLYLCHLFEAMQPGMKIYPLITRMTRIFRT